MFVKFLILFLFFLMISIRCYSMTEEQFKSEYKKISNHFKSKIISCKKHNKEILKKPIKKLEKAIHKNEYIEFIRDEKKALFYISNFDLTKLTVPQEHHYTNFMLKNCSQKNLKIYSLLEKNRKHCVEVFDELNFMKALIFATKNYNWSLETAEKVKNKILGYASLQATSSRTPLIYHLTSLHLLLEMVNYNLISKKHRKSILTIKRKGQEATDKLTNELRKNKNQFNCAGFSKFQVMQLELKKEIIKDVKTLLMKIKKTS